MKTFLSSLMFGIMLVCVPAKISADTNTVTIVVAKNATVLENLAAKEIRRYLYLRTGTLLPIITTDKLPAEGQLIVVGKKDENIIKTLSKDIGSDNIIISLEPQQYQIKTLKHGNQKAILIAGGDDLGALYGTYRFIEHFGVRFYLDGDTVPDQQINLDLPNIAEIGKPLFALRGTNPWGSHSEGIDLWNADDYKAIVAQLVKMRMNFIGIHCYPENHPFAEPTVWTGLNGDFDDKGRVSFSYPSEVFNTMRSRWGYLPKKTSDYNFGASLLFERDDWGPDVMRGYCPAPTTPEGCNEVFNRAGNLFHEAFSFARLLGVKTCVGTESPLTIPKLVQEKLKQQGKDPCNPAVIQEVYEGTFKRIMTTYPLDYYWLWTPEDWLWKGAENKQVKATVSDFNIAIAAAKEASAPFELAACGWILGPKDDKLALHQAMPHNISISVLNCLVGKDPVDPVFGQIQNRSKWAIPWLEGDPELTSPQLWVGRMRKDAADALKYGCSGLMGLHWRTRILGPNVSALAHAAWDQSDWNPDLKKKTEPSECNHPSVTPRDLSTDDFYNDWALTMFGPEAGHKAAKIFRRIDGKLPMPSTWAIGPPLGGAGGLKPDDKPWAEVKKNYAFVEEFEKLRSKAKGNANLERFDYWLNTFRYVRTQARVKCVWGQFNHAMQKVNDEKNPDKRSTLAAKLALPLYKLLIEQTGTAYGYQLSTASTYGGIATIINWEGHIGPELLEKSGKYLSEALGTAVPVDAQPSKKYQGPMRIIVPTLRSCLTENEDLKLKVIILDQIPPKDAALCWRPLSSGKYRKIPLTHIARRVYSVTIPASAIRQADIEYYIDVNSTSGHPSYFPKSAPQINQTVVVIGQRGTVTFE